MIAGVKIPFRIVSWWIISLFLIGSVLTASALEFPSLKSLGLPSFKYGRLK